MSRVTDIPHRVYTAEFKTEAVKLADEVGITEAAKRLDMPPSSIRKLAQAGDPVAVERE